MFCLSIDLKSEPSAQVWDLVSGLLYKHDCQGIDEGEIPPPTGLSALVAFDEFEHALEPGVLAPPRSFKAYFKDPVAAEKAWDVIESYLSSLLMNRAITKSEDKDYSQAWKVNFNPILAKPNWYVRAPWHEKSPDRNSIELVIEPGMAFGTGSHETTRACLELIEETVRTYSPKNVLDFGCGSGILAIALKKLGVTNVYGVDIDPLSIDASIRNADMNSVSFPVAIQIDSLKMPLLDGIVANILKNTLLDFSLKFKQWLKPDGFLVLSGLLDDQEEEIMSVYGPLGFKLVRRIVREDSSPVDLIDSANGQMRWIALHLKRSN